jgi:hypothetical protein
MTILVRVCRTCAQFIIYNDPSPENYLGKRITMQCPECGALQSWKEEDEVKAQ